MREQSYKNFNNSQPNKNRGGETKVMKKYLSSLLVLALVFTLVAPMMVFAADAAAPDAVTVGFATNASHEAGASSKLDVTLDYSATGAQTVTNTVYVDFTGTGFTVTGVGDLTGTGMSGASINQNVITYTIGASQTAYTVHPTVINPSKVATYPTTIDSVVYGPISANGVNTASTLTTKYTVKVEPSVVNTKTVTNLKVTVLEAGSVVTGKNLVYSVGAMTPNTVNSGIYTVAYDAAATESSPTISVSDGTYGGSTTFKVEHKLTVNPIAVKVGDTATIAGTLLHGDGSAVAGAAILVQVGSNLKAQTTTASNGQFTVTATFNEAGEYTVGTAATVVKGDVLTGDLALTAPTTPLVANAFTSTGIKLTAKYGDTKAAGATITLSNVLIAGGTLNATTGSLASSKTNSEGKIIEAVFTADANGEVIFDAKFLAAGMATVNGELSTVGGIAPEYVGTTSFSIVGSEKFNVQVNAPTDILSNTSTNFVVNFSDASGVGVVATPADGQLKKVDVTVEGPGTKATGSVTTTGSTVTVPFTPNQAGKITVTVVGTFVSGTGETTVSKVQEFDVKGFYVTLNVDKVVTGDVISFTANVFDHEGNPINNATVALDIAGGTDFYTYNSVNGLYDVAADTVSIGGNINNGIYTKSFKVDTVGEVNVTVNNGTYVATTSFDVVGVNVYTLSADKSLLAGKNDDLIVKVLDAEGKPVTTGVSFSTTAPSTDHVALTLPGYTMVDTDNDTFVDAYKFAGLNVTTAGDYVITAKTNAGKKQGEVVLSVVNPVVLVGYDAFTENFDNGVLVKVYDPRDNSELNFVLELTGKTGTSVTTWDIDDSSVAYTLSTTAVAEEEFFISSLVDENATDYVAAVGFNITLNTKVVDALVVPVGEASLEADIEDVYLDASNKITLVATDAEGNALEGFTVLYNGNIIGTTDENGVIVYTFRPSASGQSKFVLADSWATGETFAAVKSILDTEEPVIELLSAAEVQDASYKLVVGFTDNTKVIAAYVDNVKYPVVNNQIMLNVTLADGVNSFYVVAEDVAGNTGASFVEVTKTAPVQVDFVIGTDTGKGAPFTEGGRTFVPFRALGDAIGAYTAYDSATKVVTMELGDTVVQLTIGSNIALVNGEEVVMDVAAQVVDGRTYVPFRAVGGFFGAYVNYDAATKTVSYSF